MNSPLFAIHYRSASHECQSLEWITPSGWSTDQTRACFERRHPGATVLSIINLTSPAAALL